MVTTLRNKIESKQIVMHQGQSEEVRLPRREMVGDMGSIVFPASHVMVSWMKDIEQKNPGYWNKRIIVGENIPEKTSIKSDSFQNSAVELA